MRIQSFSAFLLLASSPACELYAKLKSSRPLDSVPLRCPAPMPLGTVVAGATKDVLARIESESSGVSPLQIIGVEQKVAFLAIGGKDNATADNEFWLRKCRTLFLRPAFEPLFLAHSSMLRHFSMSEAQISAFCSLLCGADQRPRTGQAYGLWDGVQFEQAEHAVSWYLDIQAGLSDPSLRWVMPAYIYARTIIAHPYPDGNGRLARALLFAFLARALNLHAPAIALAPSFYKNAAKIADGIRTLSRQEDWNRFALLLVEVLNEGLTLARQVRA